MSGPIGFAYDFLSKTVMRGGFGIYHRTETQNNLTTGCSIGTPHIIHLRMRLWF